MVYKQEYNSSDEDDQAMKNPILKNQPWLRKIPVQRMPKSLKVPVIMKEVDSTKELELVICVVRSP